MPSWALGLAQSSPARPVRRTHALLGISSLWLFTLLPAPGSAYNIGLLAFCAAFGAMLPDLDASESKLKHVEIGGVKPFLPPSVAINRSLGHRGLLHSLLGLSAFAVLTLPLIFWWSWQPWVALLLGYASHLGGDLCTVRGIPILYPQRKRQFLLPRPLRLVTGSLAEDMVFSLLAIAVLLLLLTHLALGSPAFGDAMLNGGT